MLNNRKAEVNLNGSMVNFLLFVIIIERNNHLYNEPFMIEQLDAVSYCIN